MKHATEAELTAHKEPVPTEEELRVGKCQYCLLRISRKGKAENEAEVIGDTFRSSQYKGGKIHDLPC